MFIVMKSVEEEIKKKVRFLELAKELGNVTQAAKLIGYSRVTYYFLKKIYDLQGEEGLRQHLCGRERLIENIEEIVLKFSSDNPKYGNSRISKELKASGIKVSTGSVHTILKKYNLNTSKQRLEKLKNDIKIEI